MITPAEWEARQARLDIERAQRRGDGDLTGTPGGSVWPGPDTVGVGSPIEIAPGRGNLEYSSGNWPIAPTALALIGHRTVSFARLFQGQPWIAAAVMWMLSKAVRVPLRVYRQGPDPADPYSRIKLAPDEHPLAAAIANPWNRGSTADLVMSLLGPVLVHGNSVTEVDDSGRRLELTSKDWRFTRPLMPFRDVVDGFRFDIDSPTLAREVSVDKVLHVKWWGPMGPIGTSPLQQLGVTLQIEDAAQRWQRAIFEHGGRPASAVVASDGFLGIKPEERRTIVAQLRKDVETIYGGPENAGRPAILPPGLTWVPIGHSSVEVELIDQRKIAREEICGVYQIPPPLMGILDRATYSNIQTQRDMTYTDVLGPPLVLVEQTLNAQIGRDLLQEPDVFCEFDFSAVLRGDRLAEIDSVRDAIGTALLSPNEGRGILNLEQSKVDGMDDFYLPLVNNLARVDEEPPKPLVGAPGAPMLPQQEGVPPAPGAPPENLGRRSRLLDEREAMLEAREADLEAREAELVH